MEEFLGCTDSNDSIVTPESLAWKILMDDDVEKYAGVIMPFVTDDEKNNDLNTMYKSLSAQFEILITMYMEMIFGMLKIKHVSENCNSDGELKEDVDFDETFKPNLSKFTVDDMLTVFREKFTKVRVFLSVNEIHDAKNYSNDFGSSSEYYCKVILKDILEGKVYFLKNRNNLDPSKQYTFAIRRDVKKSQTKLQDFYAVCALPNMKVRISFSLINIIVKDPHIV
jgi:hypothetical protein